MVQTTKLLGEAGISAARPLALGRMWRCCGRIRVSFLLQPWCPCPRLRETLAADWRGEVMASIETKRGRRCRRSNGDFIIRSGSAWMRDGFLVRVGVSAIV